MSDDIVTRLRNGNPHYGDLQADPNIYQDALNEIEHLRHELTMALGRTCRCVNTGATNE